MVAEAHVWEDGHAGELRLEAPTQGLRLGPDREDEAERRHDERDDHGERLDERIGMRPSVSGTRKRAWTVLGAVTRSVQVFFLPVQKPLQKTKRPRRPGLARRDNGRPFGEQPLAVEERRPAAADPALPMTMPGPETETLTPNCLGGGGGGGPPVPAPSELSRMIAHAPGDSRRTGHSTC